MNRTAWLATLAFVVWWGSSAAAPGGQLDFDRIFNEHGVVMLLIDPASGQIVAANPAAARFYGHSPAALQAMRIQQINTFTPEQVAAERQLAATEGRNYFIFRHRLANDEIRTVEVHSHPFPFNERTLLLSIIHDITPGRHAEPDLWHYQTRLEERVAVQVREIEHGRWWLVGVLLVALAAQTVVIVALARNIQRRRRLEHERQRLLQALEDRNVELGRLTEAMAHHFQEPVRRLASFAQRLQGPSALAADEESRRALEFIGNEAQRLSALVRDVQRYLALDHVKNSVDEATNSAAVLREAIAASPVTSVAADIVIHEPLPQVALSAKTLRQLFALLLDNALRYRHPDRIPRIVVSATTGGGRVQFRVADNGCGIAPEYRAQVFELFTRLAPSSIPGTGIGLALARKIMQQTGGSITVEEGLDGGVSLVFDAPLAQPGRADDSCHHPG